MRARTTLLLRRHQTHHLHLVTPLRTKPALLAAAAAPRKMSGNGGSGAADADERAAIVAVARLSASPPSQQQPLSPDLWNLLADSHAHPQLADYGPEDEDSKDGAPSSSFSAAAARRTATETLRRASANRLACMSVGAGVDWDRVEALAELGGDRVVPAFGIHPWWAHLHGAEEEEEEEEGGSSMRSLLEAPDEEEMQAALRSVSLAAAEGRLGIYGGSEREDGEAAAPAAREEDQPAPPPVRPIPRREWEPRLHALLAHYPRAIVGEIGLDRAAVIPGTRRARTSPQHQLALLKAQLSAAAQHRRPVSVHCVRAHGLLYDELRGRAEACAAAAKAQRSAAADADASTQQPSSVSSPFLLPPAVMLHSFGGSAEEARRFSGLERLSSGGGGSASATPNCRIYFSFSAVINSRADPEKLAKRIRAVPEDRLLLESDQVSPSALDSGLAASLALVAAARGWTVEEAARRCRHNFDAFYDSW